MVKFLHFIIVIKIKQNIQMYNLFMKYIFKYVSRYREIVNSKLLKNLMQDVLQDQSNLFYSQFKVNPHERKRLIRRSYISPPRALINHILEEVKSIITVILLKRDICIIMLILSFRCCLS